MYGERAVMLDSFPKAFSRAATSQAYFSEWQLPKCAICQVETSGNFPNVQFVKRKLLATSQMCNFSSGNLWPLLKCAIFQVETSSNFQNVHFLKWTLLRSIQATVLGSLFHVLSTALCSLDHPSRSTWPLMQPAADQKAKSNLWEVEKLYIWDLLLLWKSLLGKSPSEK